METNMSRLECKLKEIILDSREGHMSNYSRSVREDHLHGSAFGKNAFTLDDASTGTTIFMPWKLHRPLETTFNKFAHNSFMSQGSFKTFVDEFGLFPNFQNPRKKDDVLDYILSKASKNDGPLNFEEFLLALFLVAKYRGAVLRTNEQYAFNNVLNMVLNKSYEGNEENTEEKYDFNLDLKGVEQPLSKSSTKNLDGVIYHDSGLIVDTNIGKVYESPRKLETKDFSNTVQKPPKEPVSPANNTNSFDADLVKRLLEVLRDQNLLNDSKELQERVEREVKLRSDLELNYMERLNKAEADKDELNKENVLQKVKYGKLQVEFEALDREAGNLRVVNESLEQKLNEANEKLERQKFLKTRSQKVQQMMVLETEFEVKLFSIFCVYKDEHCVNGEYVVSEEQLISFCVDFGLGETDPPANENDDPKAKQAYNKVYEYSYDGKLNYGLFKEFLMNLAQLLKPELTAAEAFRYIVFQLVFSCSTSPYGDEPVEDYHPVYVDDANDPWATTNSAHDPYYQTQYNHPHQQTDPNRFVDVEGKVWFNNPARNQNARGDQSQSTPRFD